jgi:V-type H+-transporting ATPase subunit G
MYQIEGVVLVIRLSKTDELGQHSSGNQKAEEDAKKDAENQIKEIQQAAKKGKGQVVNDLLKAVFDVKPVVPDRIEVPH